MKKKFSDFKKMLKFKKSQSYKFWNIAGTKVASGDSSYIYYHTIMGINDYMVPSKCIVLFPNPSSDFITIETSELPTPSQLSISNLNGEELFTRQITSPKTQLDISSLPSGVYFVRLTCEKKAATGKFIKQ